MGILEGHRHIGSIAGSIYIMVEGLMVYVIVIYNIINKIYIYKIKYTYVIILMSLLLLIVNLGIFSYIPK